MYTQTLTTGEALFLGAPLYRPLTQPHLRVYRLVKCYSSVIPDNRLDEQKKKWEHFEWRNFMWAM